MFYGDSGTSLAVPLSSVMLLELAGVLLRLGGKSNLKKGLKSKSLCVRFGKKNKTGVTQILPHKIFV